MISPTPSSTSERLDVLGASSRQRILLKVRHNIRSQPGGRCDDEPPRLKRLVRDGTNMPKFLQRFGNHYEVWRFDDGSLGVNVLHRNRGELDRQHGHSVREWLNRYGHQDPRDTIMAARHAGDLVRTYSTDFQKGTVKFSFMRFGDSSCQAVQRLTENDVIEAVATFSARFGREFDAAQIAVHLSGAIFRAPGRLIARRGPQGWNRIPGKPRAQEARRSCQTDPESP